MKGFFVFCKFMQNQIKKPSLGRISPVVRFISLGSWWLWEMHWGQRWCSQPRAVRRAALFTHVQFPCLTVATLISFRSMEMLLFIAKIPTSYLGVQEHEPNLSRCHLNRTAGVSLLISLTQKIALLKIRGIYFQICLRSFPFEPSLDVCGLWHKTLITESDFWQRLRTGRGERGVMWENGSVPGRGAGVWAGAAKGLSLCLKILFWICQFLRAISTLFSWEEQSNCEKWI